MTISVLADSKEINHKKVALKLQYQALQSGTQDKFEAWITTIEDRWTDEIEACLQGKFPDWRGE